MSADRNEIRFGRRLGNRRFLKLVECVPNFSEGRRMDVIAAIVDEVRGAGNVKVLDLESDSNHNRSVLTFVGEPEAVKDAAMAMSDKAIELIDLNKHKGEHPRMGAVDVIPFIPISEITMEECIQLARDFGKDYASRFKVPVYLYEAAATRSDRRNLADVRKGEFEGLREQIGRDPDRKPDFGPEVIHPTAGATAIGARQILIAYNINLASDKVDVAKRIAKQVRGRDGGLTAVKALGFELKDRGLVQVSMNMVDYKASQLFKAFELVRSLAQQAGVEIAESEVVGLVPSEALTDAAKFYLRLHGFKNDQILERKLSKADSDRLVSKTLSAFCADVASEKPVPGGGSVSAYIASLAAGLVCMVARLTLKKPDSQNDGPTVNAILTESDKLRATLLAQVDRDSKSFDALMKAYRLPKETDRDKQTRSTSIQAGLKGATEAPLQTAEQAAQILSTVQRLAACANLNAISDLETATAAAYAGFLGAVANVRINLSGLKDADYRRRVQDRINTLQLQVERDQNETRSIISKRTKT
jgi:glutamate formiminotransferase/formiminotetrahydrofolate cyclodeaminase